LPCFRVNEAGIARLPVQLFKVEAERTKEAEDFWADRFACGIANAAPREPKLALKGAGINQGGARAQVVPTSCRSWTTVSGVSGQRL
jgi:hypothetical protein